MVLTPLILLEYGGCLAFIAFGLRLAFDLAGVLGRAFGHWLMPVPPLEDLHDAQE